MKMIEKALNKARELHKGQKIKGTERPYYTHITDVCKRLMKETSDPEVICGGALRDVWENTPYTREQLRQEFGNRIYSLVDFCTEPDHAHDTTKGAKRKTWKTRKAYSISKLENASDDELLIFLADKTSALHSIKLDLEAGADVWPRFNASKEDIHWYHSSIREALEKRVAEMELFQEYRRLFSVFD